MATPTFWTEYLANTDLISSAASTKTQIANVTASWGDATKANATADADCVWAARSDYWTGDDFTIVLVAQPADVYENSDPSTVFTWVASTSDILEVAFFGNHQSGDAGTDALNVYAYLGGAYRVGFYANNQCDGNAHTWVIRFNAGTMHCWRDGIAQTITPTNINSITKSASGTVAPHLNSDGTGIGHINRQAPVGLVKFFDSALTDGEVATESADPWYSAGGTNATADSGTGTGTGSGTGGEATGQFVSNATADGGIGTGTGSGTGGEATGGASGSFTSSPMYSSGVLQVSVSLDWTWYPGAIGTAPTASLVHGSGSTSVSGTLTASGLSVGTGFLLAETADGAIYYEAGTVA